MRSLRSGKKNIFEREYSTGGADHGNCVGVCECSLTQLPPNTAARKSRPKHSTSATYKAMVCGAGPAREQCCYSQLTFQGK